MQADQANSPETTRQPPLQIRRCADLAGMTSTCPRLSTGRPGFAFTLPARDIPAPPTRPPISRPRLAADRQPQRPVPSQPGPHRLAAPLRLHPRHPRHDRGQQLAQPPAGIGPRLLHADHLAPRSRSWRITRSVGSIPPRSSRSSANTSSTSYRPARASSRARRSCARCAPVHAVSPSSTCSAVTSGPRRAASVRSTASWLPDSRSSVLTRAHKAHRGDMNKPYRQSARPPVNPRKSTTQRR
jgi:hypothetical protein